VNANVGALTAGESAIRGSGDFRKAFRRALLAWYDAAGRDLPWRVRGARRPDPYHVWLSEVMLQQTTVAAVIPYYRDFLARWPTVQALADADDSAVMQAWAGLGYYARARNLLAAARLAAVQGWPQDEAGLRMLPGVGAYTGAAIAAIAFDQAANVVDGNVERVMARIAGISTPLPGAKPALRAAAAALVASDRPGDYAQALMDLGATMCTPRKPRCPQCPVFRFCQAAADGTAETLPRKAAKAARPQRFGAAFLLAAQGWGLLIRRPAAGLLGGMLALPSTPWVEGGPWPLSDALAHAPAKAQWREAGAVRHVFTHFALELRIFVAAARTLPDGERRDLAALETGLPTVFKKAAVAGRAALEQPLKNH
jgi:A/G-specific adenine glycosylase